MTTVAFTERQPATETWPTHADGGLTLVPVFERRLRPAVRDLALVGECARCLLTGKTTSSLVDVDLTTGRETRRIEHLPRIGNVWFAADGSGLGIRRTAAIGRGETTLIFIDAEGRVIHQTSVPDATSEVAEDAEGWCVGCRNGDLIAFTKHGRQRWIWTVPGADREVSDPYARRCPYYVVATGSGVVVASFRDVYAIDAQGQTAWHAALPSGTRHTWTLGHTRDNTRDRDAALQALGLSSEADATAVKAAFRRWAMKTHPDRHPSDRHAPARFHTVRRAYEQLCSAPAGEAETDSAIMTVAWTDLGPTVTFLSPTPHGTVWVGSSHGQVYEIDPPGQPAKRWNLGDGFVRAARRSDGTLGAVACGRTLRFAATGHVVDGGTTLREPHRMTMWGGALVRWQDETLELVDPGGHVQWSRSFPKRLTHVAAHGEALMCVAGTRMTCYRPEDRDAAAVVAQDVTAPTSPDLARRRASRRVPTGLVVA